MAPSASKTSKPDAPAQNRRGRPTAERVAAIDSAIKAAALQLFVEAGFEAASMDAIALAAQVSKGTLYARYDSKEPLFRAILEEQLEEWSQRASRLPRSAQESLEEQLRRHARTIVTVANWPEFRRIVSLLERSATLFPDLARDWEKLVSRRSVESLSHDMTKAGGSGVDWNFYAELFYSAIAGWHRAEVSQRAVRDDEIIAFADRVIDVMLLSIRSDQAGAVPAQPSR